MKVTPIVNGSDDTGLWDSILDAEEMEAFAEMRTLGGPGSGRYPKGSGENPQSSPGVRTTKPDGTELKIHSKVDDVEFAREVFDIDGSVDVDNHLNQVAANMVKGIPGDVTVVWTQSTVGDDTVIYMDVTRADGLELERTFRREEDKLVVRHNSFHLPESMQGSGIAKHVLADSFDVYKEIGVDTIETHANISVGGYAWAKFGFKASDPAELADQIYDRITMESQFKRMPAATRSKLLKLLETHRFDSRLPWRVAALTAKGEPIGKDLLLGTNWDAHLDMRDPEATQRLQDYVKRRAS